MLAQLAAACEETTSATSMTVFAVGWLLAGLLLGWYFGAPEKVTRSSSSSTVYYSPGGGCVHYDRECFGLKEGDVRRALEESRVQALRRRHQVILERRRWVLEEPFGKPHMGLRWQGEALLCDVLRYA